MTAIAASRTGDHPERSDSVSECAEAVIERVGPKLRVGVPLGVGKPIQLVNELYRRAAEDHRIDLEIYTALSLAPPTAGSELERRLVRPLADRIFDGVPPLRYAIDRRAGALPDNVRVVEFYLPPGRLLDNPAAQRDYVASNYTHVLRDVSARGLNVLAQAVAVRDTEHGSSYSLSSNPDLSLDILDLLASRRAEGTPTAVVGQVNRRLPFLYDDAELGADAFDWIVDDPELDFPPYGPPNEPVGDTDVMIGLYASALVRDGGTLQLGIGTMSDAVARMLIVRHRESETYADLLDAAAPDASTARTISDVGGTSGFERGLFACSEMLGEGLLELYRAGILTRRAWPHPAVQRVADAEGVDDGNARSVLDALLESGELPALLESDDVDRLRSVGVLADDVELLDGRLERPGRDPVVPDMTNSAVVARIRNGFVGERLRGGRVAHSAFFLGPRAFYERLRQLPEEERRLIRMTRVGWVNRLGDDLELQVAQRRRARFLNETMMIAGLGGAVSDGLEDGRVVSGVGGQYNFVAMAHELPGARSALMLSSTRTSSDGDLESNIRWSYGHCTIPRHLKDLVVTEYGIADLRGRTDQEVCQALIGVMDARFQDGYVARAKEAGKLEAGFRVPDRHRMNRPEAIRRAVDLACSERTCPRFPFGTDLTAEEVVLTRALRSLHSQLTQRRPPRLSAVRAALAPPAAARPYLERMGLERPSGLRQHLLQRAVVYGLALTDAI